MCDQAVNPDTVASTVPFGEFAKALVDGVPALPDCDGDTCLACFIRGEATKAVTSGGLAGMGAVPQDVEGAPRPAGSRPALRVQMPCRKHCTPEGHFRSADHAVACLTDCHGLDAGVAKHIVRAAGSRRASQEIRNAA
jgi:hypothetical protein